MSVTGTLIALLTSTGIAAVLGAVVTGIFSRRKLGADATEVITKAASGVVERMERELDRKASDMARLRETHGVEMAEQLAQHGRAMRRIIQEHEREMHDVRTVLNLHTTWDAIAVRELARLGIDLPAPPAILYPPASGD